MARAVHRLNNRSRESVMLDSIRRERDGDVPVRTIAADDPEVPARWYAVRHEAGAAAGIHRVLRPGVGARELA
ncbi:hypothetical protein CRPA12_09630 [Pseudomonas aeruginosa]|nr:hypothetical protein VNPA141581_27420 [Pseudomonas aeruginosa]